MSWTMAWDSNPEHHNGPGLGLQSIGERVRLAKGSVRIESQPGARNQAVGQNPAGLCAQRLLSRLPQVERVPPVDKPKRRPTVLIADDHPIVVDGLVALLKDRFDVVGTVSDGTRLLADAIRLRPDIVVTDISMPGLDGLEVLRRLKAKRE